jgi:hypothetical protein
MVSTPSVICLSRQNLPNIIGTSNCPTHHSTACLTFLVVIFIFITGVLGVKRGAYALASFVGGRESAASATSSADGPKLVLVATGSEVSSRDMHIPVLHFTIYCLCRRYRLRWMLPRRSLRSRPRVSGTLRASIHYVKYTPLKGIFH